MCAEICGARYFSSAHLEGRRELRVVVADAVRCDGQLIAAWRGQDSAAPGDEPVERVRVSELRECIALQEVAGFHQTRLVDEVVQFKSRRVAELLLIGILEDPVQAQVHSQMLIHLYISAGIDRENLAKWDHHRK